MTRNQALLKWAQDKLNDPECSIQSASSDASFRSYWRVFSNANTFIVMDAPTEHEDCQPFINVSNLLIESGINAPVVIEQDLQQGFLLLSDLGSDQYLDVLDIDNFILLYKDALRSLTTIQQKTPCNGLPQYGKKLLNQELELFNTWFIGKHLGIEISDEQTRIIEDSQKLLINNALEQPQSFVHRDYHSRNIMYCEGQKPGILDFQDAVLGPITYDVVSLLKDCYITWKTEDINELSDQFRQSYNQLNDCDIPSSQWQKWFDLMGMQRHMKAVGIFCRLNYRDNKPNYLKDINRTMNYIKGVCESYSELKPFMTIIDAITPSIDNL